MFPEKTSDKPGRRMDFRKKRHRGKNISNRGNSMFQSPASNTTMSCQQKGEERVAWKNFLPLPPHSCCQDPGARSQRTKINQHKPRIESLGELLRRHLQGDRKEPRAGHHYAKEFCTCQEPKRPECVCLDQKSLLL